MRVATLLSLACALQLPLHAAAVEPSAEPTANELAASARAALFASNVVEVWQTDWQGLELTLGVARRWESGEPQVLLRILKPYKYSELAYLLRPRKAGGPRIEYYRSPRMFPAGARAGRTLEVTTASRIERLRFVPGLPTLADLWPEDPAGFRYARLPDEQVEGVPCRVLETRPIEADGGYDRIVTALARDSSVALETRWFRGERQVRRIAVQPQDVEKVDGKSVVRKRLIEQQGSPPQSVDVVRFSIDPVFPDQLFTTSNLRTGRFPSY
ncbi:MAG: hypothetical protein ACHQ6T_13370 [Myxococcota bacterium]